MTDYVIAHDDLWPRVPMYRYRLYAWRPDGHDVLAATPSMGGIGVALLALHEDQRRTGGTLGDLGRVGVLDVLPDDVRCPTCTGTGMETTDPEDASACIHCGGSGVTAAPDAARNGEWIVLPFDRGDHV